MTFGSGQYPQPSGASGAYGAPQAPTGASQQYSVAAPAAPSPGLPVVPPHGRHAKLWVFGLLTVVLLAVVAYFTVALGPLASIIGFIVALVPLTIVVGGAFLIDRWEPEPWSLVIFAVLWGAVASVAIALLTDLFLSMLLPETPLRDVMRTVVQAPIVEEAAKGLGLILIYLMGKRAFDGPLDGVVYAMLIASGFAFTENIQYFALGLMDYGAAGLTQVFFVRAILSPFAHAMFTAVTGFCLGLAIRRGRRGNIPGMFFLGLAGAVLLHAFWNGSSYFVDFYLVYVVVQVPLFILFIVGIILLRREEAKLTRTRLADYVSAGWFTPQEVQMLATPEGRRAALAWAGSLPGNRRPVMKDFISDAAHLAGTRQRVVSGRDPHAAADEWALLTRTTAERQALLAR